MSLRTLQWNIGGGLIRPKDADPADPLSYTIDGLKEVMYTIRLHNPDVVTLQETHDDQVPQIAETLNMSYVVSDVYTHSHLQEGQKLGQAILSRFPLSDHRFELFYNPKLETTGPRGERWVSADKGVTSAALTINTLTIDIKTCHSFPYRRFHVEPTSEHMKPLRDDMAQRLMPLLPLYILQADLNIDEYSVNECYPPLFQEGVHEVLLNTPTTAKGRKYDHVLYRGFRHIQSIVDSSVLTDHYPVISDFELAA